jgi:PIF1-like helicase
MELFILQMVFSYLYKYLYKGPDRTLFQLNHSEQEHVDELKDYVEGRYLSAHEAAWRILGFHITSKTPSVSCLPVHLPGENIPQFNGGQTNRRSSTTLLIRYFNRPTHASFDDMCYCQYFKANVFYKWDPATPLEADEHLEQPIVGCARQKVSPRRVGCKVTRIRVVSPTCGEVFYLRCLLLRRPARSYAQARTVDGITFNTFQEAAVRLGLFANENEGHYALADAVASFCTPAQVRFLFTRICLEGYLAVPLWEEFQMALAQDFILQTHSQERGVNLGLLALASSFQESGRSLSQYGLPQPTFQCPEVVSELEAYANRTQELAEQAQLRYASMTDEQKHVYELVLTAVRTYTDTRQPRHNPLFLKGQPGRGKTFVVDAICCALRARGVIVLIVGSSALAATLYEGGRTAHNVFQIPVKEVCICRHSRFPTVSSFSAHSANRTMSQSSPRFARSPSVRN